jgi:hypothetical protein
MCETRLSSSKGLWVFVPVVLLLELLDVGTSALNFSLGAAELNPLMVAVVNNPWAFIAVKVLIAVLVAIVAVYASTRKLDSRDLRAPFLALTLLSFALVGVVLYNLAWFALKVYGGA